jgi:hypothetical protein
MTRIQRNTSSTRSVGGTIDWPITGGAINS